MVIVAGFITVDPRERAAYLASSCDIVVAARAAEGCLDFAIGADLADPGRVNIYERWESQVAVNAFRKGGPSPQQRAAILTASVAEYDIASERPLFTQGAA